jgi:hypothetical protein
VDVDAVEAALAAAMEDDIMEYGDEGCVAAEGSGDEGAAEEMAEEQDDDCSEDESLPGSRAVELGAEGDEDAATDAEEG